MTVMAKTIANSMNQLSVTGFDVEQVRNDFPALHQEVRGKPLVYLDNAATSQKPQVVIDALIRYYRESNANVHRGIHTLSERATLAYEGTRVKAQRFLNAADKREIVFVRGTTEAINLVAQSYARPKLREGDEILISEMEHHSNIVPWQILCKQTGAKLRIIPFSDSGELLFDDYLELLSPRTKIVSVVHISNSLGTINPVRRIIQAAHEFGVPVMLDGAQAVPHSAVDVQALDCDFYAFSGHKVFSPTGIGVLYGKAELLEAMDPYQGGGEMIRSVTFEETQYNVLPHKFEAGTPNIAGTVGLGAGIDYVRGLSMDALAAHEYELLRHATQSALDIPGLRLIGTAAKKAAILSFTLDCAHAHDIGTVLDADGIAVRAGHHCTMPVMAHYNVPATARASFAMYNTIQDVDTLIEGIDKVKEVFGR